MGDMDLNGGQVLAPAVAVKLGGSDVAADLGLSIQKAAVRLFSDRPSLAEITLWDCYDIKNHSLSSGLKANLKLGTGVEVQMGYQSGLTTVFCGYMESVSLDMTEQEACVLRVTAFDAVKLLKERVRCHIWKGTSHSAVVSEILDEYAWVCGREVSSTPKLPKEEDWWQQENDYDFIVNVMSGIYNSRYKFFVSDGTAYFKIQEEGEAVELEPGDGIMDFHATWHYLNQMIQVQGISETHEVYLSQSRAAGQHLSDSAGQGTVFRAAPQADTQDRADAVASAMADEEMARAVSISMILTGRPGLKPGKCVKLSGMDSWVNGTYRIRTAEHVADQDGYRTTVRLGGI